MKYHDIARDISKSATSKKLVAVCTDPEGVLGLGKGNIMVPRATVIELPKNKSLDADIRECFEDALEVMDEAIAEKAQESYPGIKSADDFKVDGKRLGDASEDEEKKNDPMGLDPDGDWTEEDLDHSLDIEDPDAIQRKYDSGAIGELNFEQFNLD